MKRSNPEEVAKLLKQCLTSNSINLEELEITASRQYSVVSISPKDSLTLMNADDILCFAQAYHLLSYVSIESAGDEFYRPVIRIICQEIDL